MLSNTKLRVGERSALAFVFAWIVSSALTTGVHAQSAVVGGLRLATDATGTPMENVPAGPGEKLYALETGDNVVYMAFDFSGTAPMTAQLRMMGPMGAMIHQTDVELIEPKTYVVEYDPGDNPLAVTEYVVNIYVEAEGSYYLADSLQMTVGDAEISPSVNELPVPTEVSPVSNPVSSVQGVPNPDSGAPAQVPGPSTMLLMLAGVGVIGLLAVVAWAGMSAMKRS